LRTIFEVIQRWAPFLPRFSGFTPGFSGILSRFSGILPGFQQIKFFSPPPLTPLDQGFGAKAVFQFEVAWYNSPSATHLNVDSVYSTFERCINA